MMILAPLLAVQGAHAVTPWEGAVQVMNCDVALAEGGKATFALTLMDDSAFIADADSANIKMDKFEPTKNGPDVMRGKAMIRRVQFDARDNTVAVRQLYEDRELLSTFVVLGGKSTGEENLAFEKAAGFCSNNSIETQQ